MKNKIRIGLVLGVILAVYTVLTFVLPFEKNGVLWLSYLFGVVAIAAQCMVLHIALGKEQTVRSKFYGFPVLRIGTVYLVVQLALGLVFMALAAPVPLWLPVVLYVLLLGAALIGFVSSDAMRDEVQRQDAVLKKDVAAMRSLQSRTNALVGLCEGESLAAAMRRLAEDLRYSDPISCPAIADQERQLAAMMDELDRSVTDEEIDAALAFCKRISAALTERNRLCKLNKE